MNESTVNVSDLKAIGTHTLLLFTNEGLERNLYLSMRDEFDREYYFKLLSPENYKTTNINALNNAIQVLAEGILHCEYAGHSESNDHPNSNGPS